MGKITLKKIFTFGFVPLFVIVGTTFVEVGAKDLPERVENLPQQINEQACIYSFIIRNETEEVSGIEIIQEETNKFFLPMSPSASTAEQIFAVMDKDCDLRLMPYTGTQLEGEPYKVELTHPKVNELTIYDEDGKIYIEETYSSDETERGDENNEDSLFNTDPDFLDQI